MDGGTACTVLAVELRIAADGDVALEALATCSVCRARSSYPATARHTADSRDG